MTDLVKLGLIAAAPPTIVAIGGFVLGFLNRATIKKVESTGKETHSLVDGTLAVQYQINATSARTLANLSGDSEHKFLADAADLKLRDHLSKLQELGLRKEGV